MTLLFIHVINSEFRSRDEGQVYASPELALTAGEQTAAALASDDLVKGRPATAIEVRVETASGKAVLRSVVSLSVARLLLSEEATPG